MDWDDARYFLAVQRAGSLSGAARALGVSHSTVRRRLAGLERDVGVALFAASPTGLAPTTAAREALGAAEAIEQAALAFDKQLSGRPEVLSGRLVVTCMDGLVPWLSRSLLAFAARHPGVELELRTGFAFLELGREADVAIRTSNTPGDAWVGRKLGRMELAPFAARSLIDQRGEDYRRLPWALFTEDSGAVETERWYRAWAGDRPPRVRVSDAGPLLDVVEAGLAASTLPLDVARRRGLVQLGEAVPKLGVDLWCLTHKDLRRSARIRAFMDCVAEWAGFA